MKISAHHRGGHLCRCLCVFERHSFGPRSIANTSNGATPLRSARGDAKDVNAATQVIDPWPPYVGNRYFPSNGQRMSDAVERYRDVSKLSQAPRPIDPVSGGGGVASPSASGGAGGGAAPAR